ncbi:Flavoprotein-like protein YCP4 [Cyberlindnera fabianii]|uniref:Flavoprotein-like protein YCP4 n=1 Tax=Cyberlindnera fabianii TaxID=36022 RepID=A0A1V2LAY6_CYBFA|nr:Flavoprotein-like protein YCP4 [Cyberlindnera fabianii]
MVKIAIIQYSTYGHVTTLAKAIQQGVVSQGGSADIFQIPETLTDEVLALIHAPAKPADIPIATLETLKEYDAFLFGFPTRYGTLPSQFSSFWDSTGGLWASGDLAGKPYGLFVSTGTPGGGQEATIRNSLSSFTHHGMIYIPLGYGAVFPLLTNLEEPHGGSPWGSGVFAGGDGSRQASELELKVATEQGSYFYNKVKKFGTSSTGTTASAATGTAAAATNKSSTTPKKETRKAQSTTAETEKQSTSSKCCILM